MKIFNACALATCFVAVSCTGSGPTGPVCNPLGDGSNGASMGSGSDDGSGSATMTTPQNGIQAALYAIPPSVYPSTGVIQAEADGEKVDSPIYFNQLYVPNQKFDAGFVAANGDPLTTADGTVISQLFALHMEGQITLGASDAPGAYQFGVYSDDGSVLAIDSGSGYQVAVNNDLSHRAELQVSSTPITLTAGQTLPFKLDYMQSSPDYLALIVLWRPFPTDPSQIQDPAVGDTNADAYWNSSVTPSQPLQAWNDLLARGWKVLAPNNYLLMGATGGTGSGSGSGDGSSSSSGPTNPCSMDSSN